MRSFLRWIRVGCLAAIGAVVVARFLVKSRAEPEAEEIRLVSILRRDELVSTAAPFSGGEVRALVGEASIDLLGVTPSPGGIHLRVALVFGGLGLIVPEGWRVHSELDTFVGGFGDATKPSSDPNAVTVYLTGFLVVGGVGVVSKPTPEVS